MNEPPDSGIPEPDADQLPAEGVQSPRLVVSWARPVAPPTVPPPPVAVPRPTAATGTDLCMGVPLAWACDWGISLGIGLVYGIWLGLTSQPLDDTNLMHPALLVGAGLPAGLAAATISWYFVCRKYGKTFVEGFQLWRRPAVQLIGCGLLGIFAAILVSALEPTEMSDAPIVKILEHEHGLLALTILALTLPVVEELYYRGFIYPILARSLGMGVAVVIVSFWFAAVHALQLWGEFWAIAVVGGMGLIWTLMRATSRSLWPSIISHWFYNASLVSIAWLTEPPSM